MMSKFTIPIIVGLAGCMAGIFGGFKMTKPPVCNCPEIPKQQSALKVNSIDVSELKKLKIRGGFTYAPSFQAEKITIVQLDTLK